ncbi:alpha/beta fold hydrolase [Corynebacterium frankenforstense]
MHSLTHDSGRLPLTRSQRSLWFTQATAPGSAICQCAELIYIDQGVDVTRLRRTITACLGQVEVFCGEFAAGPDGTPWFLPTGRAPRVTVREVATIDADALDPAVPAMSSPGIITQDELTAHTILVDRAGNVAWFARFHHLLGDGLLFHRFIDWVAHCYGSQDSPTCPFATQQQALEEDTPPREEDLDFWAQRRLPAATGAWLPATTSTVDTTQRYRVELPELPVRPGLLAVGALLAHITGAFSGLDEVVLGLPVMNRPLGERTVVAAPQVTVLPLTVPVRDGASLREQAELIRTAVEETRHHTSVRPEDIRRLTDRQDPKDKLSGATLNFKPFRGRFRFGDAAAHQETLAVGPAPDVDLVFTSDPGGGFTLTAFAHGDAATAHRVRARLEALAKLARQAARRPDEPLGSFPLVSSAPAGPRPAVETRPIAQVLRDRREIDRDATQRRRKVWQQVDGIADQILQLARQQHVEVGPGTIIGVEANRRPALPATLAAVNLLGAAFLPLVGDLPEKRRAAMVSTANPALTVDPAELAGHPCPGELHLPPLPGPDDPAYVLFTSGSTGTPKGVVVGQNAIANRLAWQVDDLKLSETDTILQKTPASFDVSVWEFLIPFAYDVQQAVASPTAHRDPRLLAEELAKTETTVCHFVPAALATFLRVLDRPLPKLRAVVTSGEALPADLARRAREDLGVDVHNYYGPTEAVVDVTRHAVTGSEPEVPIGTPVPGVYCYVLDKYERRLPEGGIGRLFLGGVQLARGYLGQPGKTAQAFRPDPFRPGARIYDSGDLAEWSAGELLYRGRADRQLKLRGQRLEPGEIECALMEHPAVAAAAVEAREIAGAAALVAYVVPRPPGPGMPGTPPSAADLSEHLTDRLPAYMVPRAYVNMRTLPVTANGKLDRSALPTPQVDSTRGRAPRTAAEVSLARIVAGLLGTPELPAADQNLFELGLNSLGAAELAAGVKELQVSDVFAAPTIEQLARRRSRVSPFARLLTLRGGTGRPLVCFHPAGGLGWAYTGLIPALPKDVPVVAVQAPGLNGDRLTESIVDAARQALADLTEAFPGQQDYDFLGWSVGGVIAQEAARHARVRRLVLLDAYPAEHWRQLPEPSEQEQLRGVYTMAGKTAPEGTLTPQAAARALRDTPGPFSGLDVDMVARIVRLIRHNAQIMREHSTGVCAIPTVFFRAAQEKTHRDPHWWDDYVGDLGVYDVDVAHPGLVSRDSLRLVAQVLTHGAPV